MQGDGWEARLKNRCVWVRGTAKERVRESEDERESYKDSKIRKREKKEGDITRRAFCLAASSDHPYTGFDT